MHNVLAPSVQPLLSLEPDMIRLRRQLAICADLLHSACRIGEPPPIIQTYHSRLSCVKIGDWVYEWSTGVPYRREEDLDLDLEHVAKSIGILVQVDEIPQYRSQRSWDTARKQMEKLYPERERSSEKIPVSLVYYIQYGPKVEDVCRWENASFNLIPSSVRFAD